MSVVAEKLSHALAAQRAAVPEGVRFAPWLTHFTDEDIADAAAACDPDESTTSLLWWREPVVADRPWATRAAAFVYAIAVDRDADSADAALELPLAPEPDVRQGYRSMILEKLFLHEAAYANIPKSIEIGVELEVVLYNEVIRRALLEGVVRRWTSTAFSSLAGSIYGDVCRIINPHSRVCCERGSRLAPQLLALDSLDKIRTIPMTEDEVYPEVFAEERRAIAEQRLVRVDKVYSDLYTCGACGQKKIYTVEAQVRSLDEGKTVQCVCDNCGNKFSG